MRKSQRQNALRGHFFGGKNAHEVLETEILVALSRRPYVVLWRNETGAVPLYKKNSDGSLVLDAQDKPVVERYIHYGKVGSGDLSGIVTVSRGEWQLGVRLEIEVKTGAGRQSDDQKNFEQMILSRGGLYLVARDLQTTCDAVDNFAGWNV